MPCRKTSTYSGVPGSGQSGGGGYATEADCLNACKEGACCETVNGVTTCRVKPQCQCQGAGKVFWGVGTTCESIQGACCDGDSCTQTAPCECLPETAKVFKGIGSKCTPNPCICVGPGLGMCCGPDTITYAGKTYLHCRDYRTQSQCNALGGRWSERQCCGCLSGDLDTYCLCEEYNPLP